ncbi:PilW family protein [Chloroflexota bacterium]
MTKLAGEKGTTLLELMAGMAILVLIMGGVVALIYQEWSGTATAKDSVTVSHEIGNAARLISHDGMMATNTNLVQGEQPVDQLNLSWLEQHDYLEIPHAANYWLEEDQILRNYDGAITTVARNISKIEFSRMGLVLTVSISCNPQWWILDKTVEQTYRVYLRATEESL